jgi:hypothetical protein
MHKSFQSQPVNNPDAIFQPCQIVCLEHATTRLYAEVIQMADGKQVCWVRPLVMIEEDLEGTEQVWWTNPANLYDLRQSSDLLLPSPAFRRALDTEVIPLLSHLSDLPSAQDGQTERSQMQLQEFIKRVCLAHPELF